ncbi:TPA: hypothetical protein ACLGML_000976 [Salmonella enterica]
MALVTQHYTSFTRPVITYVTTETAAEIPLRRRPIVVIQKQPK